MNQLIISRLVSILVLLGMGPATALAFLGSGSVTNQSGSSNISYTDTSTVSLRWSMLSFGFAPGPRISSQNGRFLDGAGSVIGINNKVLAKTITPLPNVTATVSINETLRIPKSVLYTANKRGLTQITYARTFTDCPGTDCNVLVPDPTITFNLTSSSGATFGVTNYRLRFDNGQVNNIIKQGDSVKAVAHINVNRTGTIRGVWEVATPSSTAGIPVYRIIRTVQRQLTGFATNPVESPPLPHMATGIHLVRFRFLDPVLPGDIPTLQYAVNVRTTPVKSISLLQPQNGAVVSEQTRFSWQPVKGVSAYKLEFIEPPVSTDLQTGVDEYVPVTGMMVKPDDPQAEINKVVGKKLVPGRVYWWHIIGLDENGHAVSQSAWRSIQAE